MEFFCKELINKDLIESAHNEYNSFREQVSMGIESIITRTKLKCIMDNVVESKGSPFSIDYM